MADGSLFSEEALWTLENIRTLKQRYIENPIEGSERDFYDKLKEQLTGLSPEVLRLAAEVTWFMALFPHHSFFGTEKKIQQIRTVWEWSGTSLPASPYLEPTSLMGVGNPGIAYLTRRFEQWEFFLEAFERWKSLAPERKQELMTQDAPWGFVRWLDEIPKADRRPVRNAILYFLFPDALERNLSNDHRRQIIYAFRNKIPADVRPKTARPSLFECDRAIWTIRQALEAELGTKDLDFYKPPLYQQWWSGVRDEARAQIASELDVTLRNYGLELRQCGSKKKTLADCYPTDDGTGFWAKPDATNKPLRWILQLEADGEHVLAKLPEQHGNRRIAFANTAQGNSGAVTIRIVPAIKVDEHKYVFYEAWEWILLFAFLPALQAGSSGQLFDDFDPETGTLLYLGKEQPYIFAALITLNDLNHEFSSEQLERSIKYADATTAISTFLKVSPVK
ncbi:MAG: hypothetical protein WA721_16660 [Candidatus Binataceae bacterium]